MINLYNLIKALSYRYYKFRAILISMRGISVGRNTMIEPHAVVRRQYGGNISIGNCCYICQGAMLLTHGGDIIIGNNCTVNPTTIIYGQGGVRIGNNVRIAAHCVIVPSNHIFTDTTIPIYLQGLTKKGIIIEDDVWIGAGVTVLDGVTIGEGCVVGANSVVTKSLEPYGVYAGNPVRKIKSRK